MTPEPPCPVPGGCPVCKRFPDDGTVIVGRTCVVCGNPIPCGDVLCDDCAGEAARPRGDRQ
jgi:hypothetical protein